MESVGRSSDDSGEPSYTPASIKSGSSLLLLSQLSSNAGYFVAVLIVARVLEPSGRGTVAFITVSASVLARTALVGVDQATIVLAAQRPHERGSLLTNLYGFSFVTSSLLAGVALVSVWASGSLSASLNTAELLVLAGGCIASAMTDSGYAFLLGIGRPGDWTKIALLAPWLYAAAVAGLAAAGKLTVFLAALTWTLAHVCWALLAGVLCVRRTSFGRPRTDLMREAASLGVRAWTGSMSRFLNFRVDQILLGLIGTEAMLGAYATSVNLSEVTLYLPGAVAAASIAVLAQSVESSRHERTLETFRAVLLVTGCTVVVAAVLGAPLLPVIFGSAYTSAVVPYLLLLPGAFGYAASGIFSSAMLSASRGVSSSIGPLVSLILGIGLDLLLIPSFGPSGAAAAATIAFVAGGVAAMIAYRRDHRFRGSELIPHQSDLVRVITMIRPRVTR